VLDVPPHLPSRSSASTRGHSSGLSSGEYPGSRNSLSRGHARGSARSSSCHAAGSADRRLLRHCVGPHPAHRAARHGGRAGCSIRRHGGDLIPTMAGTVVSFAMLGAAVWRVRFAPHVGGASSAGAGRAPTRAFALNVDSSGMVGNPCACKVAARACPNAVEAPAGRAARRSTCGVRHLLARGMGASQ
jgi:hypothetical protein